MARPLVATSSGIVTVVWLSISLFFTPLSFASVFSRGAKERKSFLPFRSAPAVSWQQPCSCTTHTEGGRTSPALEGHDPFGSWCTTTSFTFCSSFLSSLFSVKESGAEAGKEEVNIEMVVEHRAEEVPADSRSGVGEKGAGVEKEITNVQAGDDMGDAVGKPFATGKGTFRALFVSCLLNGITVPEVVTGGGTSMASRGMSILSLFVSYGEANISTPVVVDVVRLGWGVDITGTPHGTGGNGFVWGTASAPGAQGVQVTSHALPSVLVFTEIEKEDGSGEGENEMAPPEYASPWRCVRCGRAQQRVVVVVVVIVERGGDVTEGSGGKEGATTSSLGGVSPSRVPSGSRCGGEVLSGRVGLGVRSTVLVSQRAKEEETVHGTRLSFSGSLSTPEGVPWEMECSKEAAVASSLFCFVCFDGGSI